MTWTTQPWWQATERPVGWQYLVGAVGFILASTLAAALSQTLRPAWWGVTLGYGLGAALSVASFLLVVRRLAGRPARELAGPA